jgi:hypothetical protein
VVVQFVAATATPSMFATLGVKRLRNLLCLWIILFCRGNFHLILRSETNGEHYILQRQRGMANHTLGLSLEDLNELFAQNDIRARFTPSRLTIIEADQDLMLDS